MGSLQFKVQGIQKKSSNILNFKLTKHTLLALLMVLRSQAIKLISTDFKSEPTMILSLTVTKTHYPMIQTKDI